MRAVLKKIPLSKPLVTTEGEKTELVVYEMCAGDFRDMPLNPKMGDFLNIAARMNGILDKEIDKLSVEDMGKLVECLGEASINTPPTGGKSSAS